MERTALSERLRSLRTQLGKWKYAALIALLGVGLMLLPTADPKTEPAPVSPQPERNLAEELETLLSQMDGAGKVSCLLTYQEGRRTIYQTDTATGAGGEVKVNTVLASGGSGTELAVSVGTTEPVYRGAVIVCDGADRPSLRLEIIRAVSALTGLGSDKIAVVKRKE